MIKFYYWLSVGFIVLFSVVVYSTTIEQENNFKGIYFCDEVNNKNCKVEMLWEKTQAWLDAWAERDVVKYLAYYAPHKSPVTGLTYEQWNKQRTMRVGSASELKLSVNYLVGEAVDRNTIRFLFIQRFESHRYRDIVLKTLVYQLIGQKFYIVEETVHQSLTFDDAQFILDGLK